MPVSVPVVLDAPRPDQPQASLVRRFGAGGGAPLVILNGRARRYAGGAAATPFTVKWAPAGAAIYRTRERGHRVAGGAVLVLNRGQSYEVGFDGAAETETFALFAPAPVMQTLRRESGFGDGEPEFPEIAIDAGVELARALARLRHLMRGIPSAHEAEEGALHVLHCAVADRYAHTARAARPPARRPATRLEIMRRLARATTAIEDALAAPLSLDALAREAGLSRYHFLRLFAAAYGEPPFAYVRRRRLARAAELLAASDLPVGAVAAAVGFDSQSAFTRAFAAGAGMSPGRFRRARK
jgi:AraC-like DNA-binding protein